jgi:hypothetical protein
MASPHSLPQTTDSTWSGPRSFLDPVSFFLHLIYSVPLTQSPFCSWNITKFVNASGPLHVPLVLECFLPRYYMAYSLRSLVGCHLLIVTSPINYSSPLFFVILNATGCSICFCFETLLEVERARISIHSFDPTLRSTPAAQWELSKYC